METIQNTINVNSAEREATLQRIQSAIQELQIIDKAVGNWEEDGAIFAFQYNLGNALEDSLSILAPFNLNTAIYECLHFVNGEFAEKLSTFTHAEREQCAIDLVTHRTCIQRVLDTWTAEDN